MTYLAQRGGSQIQQEDGKNCIRISSQSVQIIAHNACNKIIYFFHIFSAVPLLLPLKTSYTHHTHRVRSGGQDWQEPGQKWDHTNLKAFVCLLQWGLQGPMTLEVIWRCCVGLQEHLKWMQFRRVGAQSQHLQSVLLQLVVHSLLLYQKLFSNAQHEASA